MWFLFLITYGLHSIFLYLGLLKKSASCPPPPQGTYMPVHITILCLASQTAVATEPFTFAPSPGFPSPPTLPAPSAGYSPSPALFTWLTLASLIKD